MIASILAILENSPIDQLEKKLGETKIEINGEIFSKLQEALNITNPGLFEEFEEPQFDENGNRRKYKISWGEDEEEEEEAKKAEAPQNLKALFDNRNFPSDPSQKTFYKLENVVNLNS